MLKNALKRRAFTPASVHPSTSIQVSEKKTRNKIHGIVPSTKIVKLGANNGNEKYPWGVLTSPPIIQKKKQKAKHMKSNFKKSFTLRILILIKMTTVTVVKNVRNTAV